MLLVAVVMVGAGIYMVSTNPNLLKNISASILQVAYVEQDGKDGTAPPDYRFIMNQHVVSTVETKADIVLPDSLKLITENRCNVLLARLDKLKSITKFDVGYILVCYDKYPEKFIEFFNTVETVSEMQAKLRPAAPEATGTPAASDQNLEPAGALTSPATVTTTPATTTTTTTTTTTPATTLPTDTLPTG